MFKMPHARRYHCQAVLITVINGILIADGAARLHDGSDTCFPGNFDAVRKREKGI